MNEPTAMTHKLESLGMGEWVGPNERLLKLADAYERYCHDSDMSEWESEVVNRPYWRMMTATHGASYSMLVPLGILEFFGIQQDFVDRLSGQHSLQEAATAIRHYVEHGHFPAEA